MNLIDLFAGIGGFSLAAHWLGWKTIAFCEKDEFCQKVLKKNFGTEIPIYDDIRTFPARSFRGTCDIITGGFPCQPFSIAGRRKGASDDRYLWDETLRAVSDARPTWFVGENVAGLASMVFEIEDVTVDSLAITRNSETDVLDKIRTQQERMQLELICKDLESVGYEAQPVFLPACAVGAPHERMRVWIIGHRRTEFSENSVLIGGRGRHNGSKHEGKLSRRTKRSHSNASDTESTDGGRLPLGEKASDAFSRLADSDDTPHPNGTGLQKIDQETESGGQSEAGFGLRDRIAGGWNTSWLEVASELCRVDARVSDRVDRLKSLGNTVVPVLVYEIFKSIEAVEHEKQNNETQKTTRKTARA